MFYEEYIVSPAIHATIIPPSLSPDLAAPLLCGMLIQALQSFTVLC